LDRGAYRGGGSSVDHDVSLVGFAKDRLEADLQAKQDDHFTGQGS
jgi:hypothetical protein